MARLIYNLVIMAAGTLIRGGVVSIRLTKDESENAVVSIAANGMTIKWDEKVEKALRKTVKVDELEAATVQAYFSGMIAKEANVTLQIEQGTENFEIKATQQQEALVN
jgi:histidine phosphotransferase ChpT